MRLAAVIEYDGSAYSGWQAQKDTHTVQETVERALSSVADEPLKVICAGRTDAGVHAVGQIVHFDTSASRTERSWVLGANSNLPTDVCLRSARRTRSDFHARFSARSRRYRYVILNRWVRPALLRSRVCWERRTLEAGTMQQAATALIGEHDFSSFRALSCQAHSPVRTLHELSVTRAGDCVYIDVHANAFLHHMVRNIAGVLIAVGCGEKSPDWPLELLAVRDRTRGGVTASAAGLYLVHVDYPEEHGFDGSFKLPQFA